MLNILFFFASAFSGYENVYNHNRFFYELYLGTDEHLDQLGVIHLIGLRQLIDLRLEGIEEDLLFSDRRFSHEFFKRYPLPMFHVEHSTK